MNISKILTVVLSVAVALSASGPAFAQTQPQQPQQPQQPGGGFRGLFPGNFGGVGQPPRINSAQGGFGVSALGGVATSPGAPITLPPVSVAGQVGGAPVINQPGGGAAQNPNLRALLFLHFLRSNGGINGGSGGGALGGGAGGLFGGGQGTNSMGQFGQSGQFGQFGQGAQMGGVGGKFGNTGMAQIGGGGQFGSRYGL